MAQICNLWSAMYSVASCRIATLSIELGVDELSWSTLTNILDREICTTTHNPAQSRTAQHNPASRMAVAYHSASPRTTPSTILQILRQPSAISTTAHDLHDQAPLITLVHYPHHFSPYRTTVPYHRALPVPPPTTPYHLAPFPQYQEHAPPPTIPHHSEPTDTTRRTTQCYPALPASIRTSSHTAAQLRTVSNGSAPRRTTSTGWRRVETIWGPKETRR